MLDFEPQDFEFTAAMWRDEDERHSCAHCAHCRGGYASGFHCALLLERLRGDLLPVRRVLLEDAEGICDSYECEYGRFRRNTGEYPHGVDRDEFFSDPDGPGRKYAA